MSSFLLRKTEACSHSLIYLESLTAGLHSRRWLG